MYGLFEDEDDIFMGSPKSKLMDVIFNANNDIVRSELEKFIERAAALELMLMEKMGTEDVETELKRYMLNNVSDIDNKSKSLYIELMGHILSQSE